jgi:hypothetical protein
MNERIKALALQAGAVNVWEWASDDVLDTKNMDAEKFAELIVRECLAHGKLTQSQAVVNGSEEYNAGREMGIEVFMNQIKQHFGVEEK